MGAGVPHDWLAKSAHIGEGTGGYPVRRGPKLPGVNRYYLTYRIVSALFVAAIGVCWVVSGLRGEIQPWRVGFGLFIVLFCGAVNVLTIYRALRKPATETRPPGHDGAGFSSRP